MYFFCVATKDSCVYIENYSADLEYNNGYAIRWLLIAELADEGKTADEIAFIERAFGL